MDELGFIIFAQNTLDSLKRELKTISTSKLKLDDREINETARQIYIIIDKLASNKIEDSQKFQFVVEAMNILENFKNNVMGKMIEIYNKEVGLICKNNDFMTLIKLEIQESHILSNFAETFSNSLSAFQDFYNIYDIIMNHKDLLASNALIKQMSRIIKLYQPIWKINDLINNFLIKRVKPEPSNNIPYLSTYLSYCKEIQFESILNEEDFNEIIRANTSKSDTNDSDNSQQELQDFLRIKNEQEYRRDQLKEIQSLKCSSMKMKNDQIVARDENTGLKPKYKNVSLIQSSFKGNLYKYALPKILPEASPNEVISQLDIIFKSNTSDLEQRSQLIRNYFLTIIK